VSVKQSVYLLQLLMDFRTCLGPVSPNYQPAQEAINAGTPMQSSPSMSSAFERWSGFRRFAGTSHGA
jgi:hypothetical protein